MPENSIDSPIFTPVTFGPMTLRNRVIRSAAFENMAYHNRPSQDLYNYHVAVARGGVGMTTLAYTPIRTLIHYMDIRKLWWLKAMIGVFGRAMIPTVPYSDGYFLERAKRFRAAVSLPLIYVGGLTSRSLMEEVLAEGFQGLQMARALIRDTDFVNKLRTGEVERSGCGHSNYCIGRMYSLEMKCNRCVADMPERLRREVKNAEKRWSH